MGREASAILPAQWDYRGWRKRAAFWHVSALVCPAKRRIHHDKKRRDACATLRVDLTLFPAHVTLHCSMKNTSSTRKPPSDDAQPKLVIKKYSDRRLYDSGASRYVKLEDVARMVRDGIEVKVVDARSGKDLTYLILTQIILEDARERETPLPLQLLTQLVRASDRATHDFLSWYLHNTLDLYQKAQDAVRSRLPEAKAAVARPIEFVRNLLAEHPAPPLPPAADITEVEQLRRRVEELEEQLARREKNKSTGTAQAKRKSQGAEP